MLQAQIFIDLEETIGDQSLEDYIMQFLAEHHILGATSFRGHSGFGKNHRIKRPSELFSFDEPPAMILFIDEEEKVRHVVGLLRKHMKGGFITVHPIEKL
ncbi:DUF190 domain-containing protein [Chryseolinea lacunae]|uniref:DUF190 domain-containing protein n=1 Tax=Chryseolinea lacunae TaxID=2801331 RepID=A0ABS1KN11_9BACT|nr:DUF190 domain-containing protein [Chryseolinea lacunae]MBL0740831.1 DUF190 domain-containing protein [Chryseolinea lacunae]